MRVAPLLRRARRLSTAPLPHWEGSSLPVASAECLPPRYYTNQAVAAAERRAIFMRSWQYVPAAARAAANGAFECGTHAGGVRYLLSRAKDGELRAFRNACRHHHHSVAKGSGTASQFVCPYHGWTYGLDGRLTKATGIGGIEGFKAKEHGLEKLPFAQAGVGSFAWLGRLPTGEQPPPIDDWLGEPSASALRAALSPLREAPDSANADVAQPPLRHVASRSYSVESNWKVFVDNYLDGGLHVPVAHKGLADNLDFGSYTTQAAGPHAVVQSVGGRAERVGGTASYTYIWPNLMLNRYGGGDGAPRWLDANLVVPDLKEPHRRCVVYFDWFVEDWAADDTKYVDESLAASEVVQQEDMALCADVQLSLEADEGQRGRFAPKYEHGMHAFHRLVYETLQGAAAE